MDMLYDMVIHFSQPSRDFFYFRICRGFYETYRNFLAHVVLSKPSPHLGYDHRYAEPLAKAIRTADIVLDTWTTDEVLFEFKATFGHDRWTSDLKQRLGVSMGEIESEAFCQGQTLKETSRWSMEFPIEHGQPEYLSDEEELSDL